MFTCKLLEPSLQHQTEANRHSLFIKSKIATITCPVDVLKAVKNPVEQQNFRNAYLRDGRAMVRWLAWLEKMLLKNGKKVGEWAAAQGLTRERRKEDYFA